jgi:hypothetical protein
LIIKSHIRGGYRAAADYLKAQGKNEKIRLVEISDLDAHNLDEAFRNMWVVASSTKATKPLHHISINPFKDERLTDAQAIKIAERAEQKFGYKHGEHQRVIVEHIRDGRQHFHVFWNRVSLTTHRPIWPGQHWNKSKQTAREMEKELGLKTPMPRRMKRARASAAVSGRRTKMGGRYRGLMPNVLKPPRIIPALPPKPTFQPAMRWATHRRRRRDENIPDSERLKFAKRPDHDLIELLIWAWENKRFDILYSFGIILPPDYFEP